MKNIKINLLPWREELKVIREESLKKSFVYSAIIGLMLTAVMIFIAKQVLSQQEARVQIIDTELAKYKDAQELLAKQEKDVKDLTNRIRVLIELNDQRAKIVELMERFSKAHQADVFLRSLSFDVKGLEFNGFASNQKTLIQYLRLIEENKVGFTPIPVNQEVLIQNKDRVVNYSVVMKPAI